MKHARITLAAVLAVLAGLVGLAAGTGAASANAAATNTTLTLTIANCEGCVVGLTSVMAADYEDLWSSKEKKVKNNGTFHPGAKKVEAKPDGHVEGADKAKVDVGTEGGEKVIENLTLADKQ